MKCIFLHEMLALSLEPCLSLSVEPRLSLASSKAVGMLQDSVSYSLIPGTLKLGSVDELPSLAGNRRSARERRPVAGVLNHRLGSSAGMELLWTNKNTGFLG